MMVRMSVGEEVSEHFIFDEAARAVVPLALLVLDDTSLVIQLLRVIAPSR